MFKVWRILSILILLSAYLLAYFFPQTASAASCTFTYNPVVPNQNMDKLTVTIKSSDLAANNYRIVFDLPNGGTHPKSSTASLPFDPTTGITVEFDKLPVNGWGAGKYKLFFIKSGESIDKAVCSTEFTIMDIPVSSSSCVTSIESKPIEPNTNVVLVIKDIENGTYDIFINNVFKFTNSLSTNNRLDLGTFNVGTYTILIKNKNQPPRLQCTPVSFEVAPLGSGGGGQVTTSPGAGTIPKATPCLDPAKCTFGGGKQISGCTDDKDHPAIATAIGCIHTNPAEFAKDFLTFVIAIGGGLAFLMMLLGTFQMLTSAGNPDTLNAGRERLTSAVIGLLFIIFAVLLMQIIGVDILKLPEFNR